jgi:hypothetical protein
MGKNKNKEATYPLPYFSNPCSSSIGGGGGRYVVRVLGFRLIFCGQQASCYPQASLFTIYQVSLDSMSAIPPARQHNIASSPLASPDTHTEKMPDRMSEYMSDKMSE